MTNRYRSLFWPAILILVGVFALLINSGLVPAERLDRLADLWPLILIVIGLELMVRRALRGPTAEIAALLVVLVAIVGAAAYVALGPAIPSGTQTLDAAAKVGSVEHAGVRVDAGAANITMQGSTALGGDLFRAHIEYSGRKPDVGVDASTGEVHISQSNTSGFFFQNRRFALSLLLNASVPWKIAVNSGASSDTFNLSSLQLSSIEVNTGASHETINLGTPSGTVPVTINGGALTVNAHRARGVAASVAVSGGAVNLSLDGRQSHAVGTLNAQTSDYDGAADRYQFQINGGACNVTLDQSLSES